MKKLFVVLGVVACGFAFTSCKKDCKCTLEYDLAGTATKYEWSAGELSKSDCDAVKAPTGYPEEAKVSCKSE
jgi:hypothetical protein